MGKCKHYYKHLENNHVERKSLLECTICGKREKKKYRLIGSGNTSDGYHTFDELYYHRLMLFSALSCTNEFKDKFWRSTLHHDGTMYDNYFIVGVSTPRGDYTYHYHMEHWERFSHVKTLDLAPEYDGHKPEDISRLFSVFYDSELAKNSGAILKGNVLLTEDVENADGGKWIDIEGSLHVQDEFSHESFSDVFLNFLNKMGWSFAGITNAQSEEGEDELLPPPVSAPRMRVSHYPQLPCDPFHVPVSTLQEAHKIANLLADYDNFQFKKGIKPDYSNTTLLEVFNEEYGEWEDWIDEETGIDNIHEYFEHLENELNEK